jgi:hypothetical protein
LMEIVKSFYKRVTFHKTFKIFYAGTLIRSTIELSCLRVKSEIIIPFGNINIFIFFLPKYFVSLLSPRWCL